MRIMLHTNAPMLHTGYGQQARLLGQAMTRDGHQVAVSAFAGLLGEPIEWGGMSILPGGTTQFGIDTIIPHARTQGADLVVTLMDFWQMAPIAEHLQQLNLAAWMPVDCDPLGWTDRETLRRARAQPLAMSRFGLRMLLEAGFGNTVYLPHAVDTQVFQPLPAEERTRYRAALGIDGRFVVGIVAANNDAIRKGFAEQFEAFRRLHKSHPEALLLVHTVAEAPRGLNLPQMARLMGLQEGSYQFTDPYAQTSGIYDDQMMVDFYNVIDVLSQCSYAEGFGLPVIEAQACGTPVISTRGSAMDELRGAGWAIASQPFWNHVHGAWWQRPDIAAIERAYEKAYKWAGSKREQARRFALDYDIRDVYARHWQPYLQAKIAELAKAAAEQQAAEA